MNRPLPGSAEFERELASLVSQMLDIENRLQALTGGQVDAVLAPTGRTHLLAQAQQRLLISEEQQRHNATVQTAVLNALPAHVALLDAQGRIVSVNEAWKRFGLANGMPDPGFGVGADYPSVCEGTEGPGASEARAVARGLRAVLAGDIRFLSIVYPCHSPGEQRWYRMMVTPLDETKPAGAVVMHIDISERVRAENALRESEQRYRGVVDVLPDLVFTVVADRITFINQAGLRLLNAGDATLVLGRPPQALFPADGPALRRLGVLAQAALPEEDAVFVEDRLLTLDGGVVDVEVAASSHIPDGHRVIQVVCRDLSERRQSEAQRRQLTERLTHTLESLTDGFCALDRDWRVTYLNPLAERMLARPRTELLGHVIWDQYPDLASTAIGAALKRAMKEQGPVQLVERVLPADRWFDLRIYGAAQGLAIYARDVTRQRNLAALLEEEHLRLVQAQAVARMGSWEINLVTGDVVWSAETHRIFETGAQNLQPTHARFLALVHPDDRLLVEAAFVASFGVQTQQSIEHRVLLADDRVKFVEERWQIFHSMDGQPLRALGTCQDITERKLAEQLLRRSESMVKLAGHMARLGAWSVDLQSMVVDWSDVVAAIHEEPAGTSPSVDEAMAYYAPEYRETVRTHFFRCVDEGVAFDLELQIITANGRRRWVRLIGQPERDGAGRIVQVRGALQEISERKAAEAATRELAERLQNTLESITDGFITMDVKWRFTYVNRQAEHLLGRSRADLLGRDMWLEFPESVGSVAQQAYERAVREGVATTFEYHYPPLDRWFEANAYPSSQGLAVYFRDVTGRKQDQEALRDLNAELESRVLARTAELSQAREEAELASQAKSAFLAAMSHEIRTPMNGVIGMVDVLHQTSLQGYQVEMVDLIRDSAYSLLGIIEDILDFSKIEAGHMPIEREPLRLADLVENVCGMLDHMASKRDVRIAVFVDPAVPPLLVGDEARLRQILVNLVGNAIKFSGSGSQPGRVAVRTRLVEEDSQAATVELSVVDNGIGMDEATMARLFTPFSQADVSTTRRFGGTGLGLAISSALVDLMGGEISVRSAPAQGAAFTVRQKLLRGEGKDAVDPSTKKAADDVAGLSCCVVGDELPLADDLIAYLEHAGVRVERAAQASEAVTASLWLVLPSQAAAGPERLRALAPAGGNTRFVLLGSGRRRRPRVEAPDLVRLDVCGLTRRSLYRVLAQISGRLTPATVAEDEDKRLSQVVPMSGQQHVLRKGAQILVAEDNETNRKVIQHQLQLVGFEAEFAEDGQLALELWRSGDFGLVFTDLHMPRVDGYALAATIRAEEQAQGGRRTAIVALTANALRDEELRCRAAGMDAYLSKPVRLARLRAAIDEWLPAAGDIVDSAKASQAGSLPVFEVSSADIGGSEHELLPLLDLTLLKSLIGDDEAVVADVLRAFCDSAREIRTVLAEAFAGKDLRGVADAAHKLKSGALAIGARQLSQHCIELEVAAEAGREVAVGALLESVEADLSAVFHCLEGSG